MPPDLPRAMLEHATGFIHRLVSRAAAAGTEGDDECAHERGEEGFVSKEVHPPDSSLSPRPDDSFAKGPLPSHTDAFVRIGTVVLFSLEDGTNTVWRIAPTKP